MKGHPLQGARVQVVKVIEVSEEDDSEIPVVRVRLLDTVAACYPAGTEVEIAPCEFDANFVG